MPPTTFKNCVRYYLCLIIVLLFFSSTALASDAVSGNFSSSSGTKIVLNLSIHSPIPTALIVEEYFSSGNTIASTSPNARKVNSKNGNVKWLIKNLKNNNLTLTTTLQAPLRGKVKAIVRYHAPQSGKMIELHIDS